MRGIRTLAVVLVLIACASACEVDATLRVDVAADGSGVVRAHVALDPAAVRAVEVAGTPLEQAVRLDDLRRAGWRVRWRREDGGGARLTLRKPFGDPAGAAAVVRELSGPAGPVPEADVTRTTSRWRTTWGVRLVGDLEAVRAGVQEDAELVERLVAERVDPVATDLRLTAKLREALRLRLVGDLPDAAPATIEVRAGERAVLDESSTRTDTARLGATAIGVALLAGGAGLAAAGLLRRRRGVRAAG